MPWTPRPPGSDATPPWPLPGSRPPGPDSAPEAARETVSAPETHRPVAADALLRTDFLNAARRNRASTRWLVAAILAIGGLLGYLIGLAGELLTRPDVYNPATGRYDSVPFEPTMLLSVPGAVSAAMVVLIAALWSGAALLWGDRIALRLNGAREISAADEPMLFNVVEEMSIAAGIPMPKVAVMETPGLNAFATGMRPETATIGVTRGLLDSLSRDELQGVVAHETAHIVNNDIRFMTAVGVMIGLIAAISTAILRMGRLALHAGGRGGGGRAGGGRGGGRGGAALLLVVAALMLVAALAPVATRMMKYALSRQREYLADATAVRLTRYPQGLIGALQKIAGTPVEAFHYSTATRHMYIADPELVQAAAGRPRKAWKSTHPPVEDRIKRLRDLR